MKNYSLTQKLLHDLVLKNKFIQKSLYDLEKVFFSEKNIENIKNGSHIFITGLPRSGTTILLNNIYNSNQFSSLTYKQMPFVLSPNIFSKLNFFSSNELKERAHADGIFFNLNSPEAFDEIFFSIFKEDEISSEIYNFINLILSLNKKDRYLSKNNSNYKRIDLINKLLPKSFFLIPIRDPAQQAFSLFNQHNHFLRIQEEDNFINRYMNYLGHFEFGKSHKAWFKSEKFNNSNDPNYWLEQWLKFYEEIYNKYKNHRNCLIIKYESFTDLKFINFLSNKLNIKIDDKFFKDKNKEININFDQELLGRAYNFYKKNLLVY